MGVDRQFKARHGSVSIILPEAVQPELKRSCLKKQTKADLLAYSCIPSTNEVEAGGLVIQGYPYKARSEANLGYMKPYFRKLSRGTLWEKGMIFVP